MTPDEMARLLRAADMAYAAMASRPAGKGPRAGSSRTPAEKRAILARHERLRGQFYGAPPESERLPMFASVSEPADGRVCRYF